MAAHLLELLFFGGQVLAVAFLVYGAWLCFTAGRERRKDAPAKEKPASAAGASRDPEGGAWA